MTTTGSSPAASGLASWRSRARTHSIAVSPAVPTDIAQRASRPSGTRTSHSGLTLASSEKPPQCSSPRPKPVAIT